MLDKAAEPTTHFSHIGWNHQLRTSNLLLQGVKYSEWSHILYTRSDVDSRIDIVFVVLATGP